MIGEDSTLSRRPASPTNTGQVPSFRQSAAACLRLAGGSARETNWAAEACSIVCVEQNVRASASSRPPPEKGVLFSMWTDTLQSWDATVESLLKEERE